MTTFTDLGLDSRIMDALTTEGYTTPTPIQAQAIPSVMAGRDLLGIAQTGTGKTAAFALPILHRLAQNPQPPRHRTARVLVLSPTRELASQIAESFKTYGRNFNLKIITIFGGVSFKPQIQALNGGVDILVATPGRLLDHMSSRMLTLDNTEILVLDEADQMMDLGFIQPLRQIISKLPAKRQSLFFSATMPHEIGALAAELLHNPEKVAVTPAAKTADRVEQKIIFVEQAKKRSMLAELFSNPEMTRTLVFTRTKRGADRVARHLNSVGVPVSAIHGNKSQSQREQAMTQFKASKIRALIATDIAARGIDIDSISHVVNYELPNVPESYVHRIGRTARAGAEGIAISLVDGDERAYLRDIERLTRQQIPSEDRRGDSSLAVVANDHKAEREEEEAYAAGDKRRTPRPFKAREGGSRPFNKGGDRGGFKGRRDDRGPDRSAGGRDFKPAFDKAPVNDDAAPRTGGYDPLNSVAPETIETSGWQTVPHTADGGDRRPPRRDGGMRPSRDGGFNRGREGGGFKKPREAGFTKSRDGGNFGRSRPDGDRPSRAEGDRPRSFDGPRGPRREGGFNKSREGGPRSEAREGGFKSESREGGFKPERREGGSFNKRPFGGSGDKPAWAGKDRKPFNRGDRPERTSEGASAGGEFRKPRGEFRKPFDGPRGADRPAGERTFRRDDDRRDGPRKPWSNREGGSSDRGADRGPPRGDRSGPPRGSDRGDRAGDRHEARGDRPHRPFERRPDSRGPDSGPRREGGFNQSREGGFKPERREGGFKPERREGGGGFKSGGFRGSKPAGGAPRSSGGEGRLSRPRAAKE